MKIIISAGAIGAAMGVLGLFGSGIASAAPDVEGMTYEDAVAAIEEDGGIPKIAVTFGDRQDAMACLPRHQGYRRFLCRGPHPGCRVRRARRGRRSEGELAEAGEVPGEAEELPEE